MPADTNSILNANLLESILPLRYEIDKAQEIVTPHFATLSHGDYIEICPTQTKLPQPNRAPSCDQICGSKEKCTVTKNEKCDSVSSLISNAWVGVGGNLVNAINHMDNSPDSKKLNDSLKSNFNWSKKNKSEPDLPRKVRKNLNGALQKMEEHLCTRCTKNCNPSKDVVQIMQARGENCLNSNCFLVCIPGFKNKKVNRNHALLHELMHRIVEGHGEKSDIYRGAPNYPGKPEDALKLPDTYASLVDDLVAKSKK